MSYKRKGQVFLIMTILVVSFIIGISSVLLEIKQSDFIEPAPDADITLRGWEVTIDSLHQISDIYLAQISQNHLSEDPSLIDPPLQNLSNYLTNRGLTNYVNQSTIIDFIPLNDTNTQTLSVNVVFDVYLASSSTSITQSIEIEIIYEIDASLPGIIVITKTTNGIPEFLDNCSFSITVTNNGNGSYSHTSNNVAISSLTDNSVFFQVTTAP